MKHTLSLFKTRFAGQGVARKSRPWSADPSRGPHQCAALLAAGIATLALVSGLAACAPGVADDATPCSWRCAAIPIIPGQAASQAIGETDLNTRVAGSPPSASGFIPIGNPAVAGGYVFVSDAFNGRVMAFPVAGLTDGEAASFVLGAPSPTSPSGLNPTPEDFSAIDMATDGTHLALVDGFADRVMIYNTIPTTNYAPADVEVGQPGMNEFVADNQLACDQSSFLGASSVSLGGGKLVVADTNNHRVLIWNSIPTVSGQPADVVVGQPDFTSCLPNVTGSATPTASTLDGPVDAWTDGTNLYVADQGNNRVLMWHTMPTTNGQAADAVLGQADFVSALFPGANDFSFDNITGISADSTSLYVTDSGFVRVAVYTPIPANGAIDTGVSFFLGQSTVTGSTPGTSQILFETPVGVTSSASVVYVPDQANARMLTFTAPVSANQPNAVNVLGQSSFTAGVGTSAQFPASVTATGITPGFSTVLIGNNLYVPDIGVAPRVMQYTMPISGIPTPNSVQGVPSTASNNLAFEGITSNPGQDFAPTTVATDGTNLFVTDQAFNQVMGFTGAPTTTYATATLPVGSTAVGTAMSGCAQNTFQFIEGGIAIGGGKLVVPDTFGHRVLIWNSIPTVGNQNSDLVLGQPDFTHCLPNQGGTKILNATAHPYSMRSPLSAWTDGNRLLVADEANNRVLGWNTFPTSNGQPADFALGQPDLNTRIPILPPTQSSLRQPAGVTSLNGEIFVADTANNRVMIWATWPGSSGVAADSWVGQADPNHAIGGTSATNMAFPEGVAIINNQLWVMDTQNYRLLVFGTQFSN